MVIMNPDSTDPDPSVPQDPQEQQDPNYEIRLRTALDLRPYMGFLKELFSQRVNGSEGEVHEERILSSSDSESEAGGLRTPNPNYEQGSNEGFETFVPESILIVSEDDVKVEPPEELEVVPEFMGFEPESQMDPDIGHGSVISGDPQSLCAFLRLDVEKHPLPTPVTLVVLSPKEEEEEEDDFNDDNESLSEYMMDTTNSAATATLSLFKSSLAGIGLGLGSSDDYSSGTRSSSIASAQSSPSSPEDQDLDSQSQSSSLATTTTSGHSSSAAAATHHTRANIPINNIFQITITTIEVLNLRRKRVWIGICKNEITRAYQNHQANVTRTLEMSRRVAQECGLHFIGEFSRKIMFKKFVNFTQSLGPKLLEIEAQRPSGKDQVLSTTTWMHKLQSLNLNGILTDPNDYRRIFLVFSLLKKLNEPPAAAAQNHSKFLVITSRSRLPIWTSQSRRQGIGSLVIKTPEGLTAAEIGNEWDLVIIDHITFFRECPKFLGGLKTSGSKFLLLDKWVDLDFIGRDAELLEYFLSFLIPNSSRMESSKTIPFAFGPTVSAQLKLFVNQTKVATTTTTLQTKVLCPLTPKQRKLYDELNMKKNRVLPPIKNLLTKLRQICNHPDLYVPLSQRFPIQEHNVPKIQVPTYPPRIKNIWKKSQRILVEDLNYDFAKFEVKTSPLINLLRLDNGPIYNLTDDESKNLIPSSFFIIEYPDLWRTTKNPLIPLNSCPKLSALSEILQSAVPLSKILIIHHMSTMGKWLVKFLQKIHPENIQISIQHQDKSSDAEMSEYADMIIYYDPPFLTPPTPAEKCSKIQEPENIYYLITQDTMEEIVWRKKLFQKKNYKKN